VADEPWVGLADVVRGVRSELRAAMAEGQGSDLRFEVGPVELEFAVDVRKDAAVDVSARVYVVSFGAKGGGSTASTHRLKLTLNPVDAHGNRPQVNTQVPEIPGE
jgi:hypothetical protein